MLIPITLSEAKEVPKKIQLLRAGEFLSEQYGNLKITKEILFGLKKNFDEKVRGYEDGKLPIDYFHENEKIAAGWIENLTLSENGAELWADVKWTPKAEKMLSEGELRYVSAEFSFNYQDNESGKKFGPTLFGAGLTNRPFIKGMDPVMALNEKNQENGGKKMDEKDKEIEALKAKIAEMQKAMDGKDMEMSDLKKKLGETQAQYAEEKKCAEKRDNFNKMLAEGKAVEAQRESFMSGDMVKFAELAKPTNMNAKGSHDSNDQNDSSKSAQDKVLELAEVIVAQKKVSLHEGISQVLRANKELNAQYQKEVSL